MLLGFERRISALEEKIWLPVTRSRSLRSSRSTFRSARYVANGLDQQIDQVVCQAATAQIGKGCQPSEPRRRRVAAQLVGASTATRWR